MKLYYANTAIFNVMIFTWWTCVEIDDRYIDNSCTIGHEIVVPLNFKKTRKTGKWENYDTLSKSGNSPDPWYPILQNAKTSFNIKTRRNSFFVLIYL